MSATNRRFARRAKLQPNPVKRALTPTHSSKQPPDDSQAANSPAVINTLVSPSVLQIPSATAILSERPCPLPRRAVSEDAAGRAPNAGRPHYVIKRRVGKKTISTYVGAKDGAADIAFIDSIFRQAALHNRHVANELILKLKLIHAENERNFNATDAEITRALTASGYHRIDRGPWRKMRLRAKEEVIPNTLYSMPARPQDSLTTLTPLLRERAKVCRNHAIAV